MTSKRKTPTRNEDHPEMCSLMRLRSSASALLFEPQPAER
jgi:hypothetical protein